MSKPPSYMKFQETFEDMLNNAAAVKGEAYTKLVMHIINQKAMIKLMGIVSDMSAQEGESILKQPDAASAFGHMMGTILKQNISAMQDALEISDELLKEALEFADTLTEKGEDIAKHMGDEEDE